MKTLNVAIKGKLEISDADFEKVACRPKTENRGRPRPTQPSTKKHKPREKRSGELFGDHKETLDWFLAQKMTKSAREVWESCDEPEKLFWLIDQSLYERAHKKIVLAMCQCARLSLACFPANDGRLLWAIEQTERWARGEAGTDWYTIRDANDVSLDITGDYMTMTHTEKYKLGPNFAKEHSILLAASNANDGIYAATCYAMRTTEFFPRIVDETYPALWQAAYEKAYNEATKFYDDLDRAFQAVCAAEDALEGSTPMARKKCCDILRTAFKI